MSIIKSYRCDKCKIIKHEKEIVAVSKQIDMFDRLESYPTKYTQLDRYDTHLCTTCFQTHVISIAEKNTNKKKDPASYDLKVRELSYHLKQLCIQATRESKG